MRNRNRAAFTIIELLVVVSIIALLVGILLPAISKARDGAKLTNSLTNLRNLGAAHASYAAGHNDRQLTFWVDSITSYGTSACSAYSAYGAQVGNTHPSVVLGYGPEHYGSGNKVLYQYRLDGGYPGHHCWAGQPIHWTGFNFGVFRFGHQSRSFSTYLGGRYYDPVFFAPKDILLWDIVKDGFDAPDEFAMIPADDTTEGSVLFTSSYCLSPAAMWAPEVLSYKPTTGATYSNPWAMPAGVRCPPMGHALFPDLKTHMVEHYWLQNLNEMRCNPGFSSPGTYNGCEPYFYNHSIDSTPMALFFDGHVEGIGVREAQMADTRQRAQSDHGLWSRDTPMGQNGYFINYGYDIEANTSFHILTTDGIRGRDTYSH